MNTYRENNQAVLRAFQQEELNKLGIKEQNIAQLRLCYEEIKKQLTALDSRLGSAYNIVNAADYKTEIYSLATKATKSVRVLLPLVNDILFELENYAALYEGRTSVFYTPSDKWQAMNKAFNLNFNASLTKQDQIEVSYNPLMNPNNEMEPIGIAYYLAFERLDKDMDISKVEQLSADGALLKLDMFEFSKPNTALIDVAKIRAMNNKPLQPMYNYQAYLFVEIDVTYKREINNFEDFLSTGSFPFCINHDMDAYSPQLFYKQFNTFKNKLMYSSDLANKWSNLVTKKKAVNPLISDELVSQLTKVGTHLNELNSATNSCYYQLIRLEE